MYGRSTWKLEAEQQPASLQRQAEAVSAGRPRAEHGPRVPQGFELEGEDSGPGRPRRGAGGAPGGVARARGGVQGVEQSAAPVEACHVGDLRSKEAHKNTLIFMRKKTKHSLRKCTILSLAPSLAGSH